MRRTKAMLIYRRTKNLRAVQLLLGHSKLDYFPRRTTSTDAHAGSLAAGCVAEHGLAREVVKSMF